VKRNSLHRIQRLTQREDYDRAFKQGKRITLPGLTILRINNCCDYARLGISVSKKRISTAVGRNRAKRLIRELFRKNKKLFSPGYDYVFIPVRNFLQISWREHNKNLVAALKQNMEYV